MILLDTNVISEPLRHRPDPAVLDWLDAQAIETLYLSTISLAELRVGIAALPDGKRKNSLRKNLDEQVLPLFDSRILTFDIPSADAYAVLRARARAAGKAVASADGYIAAIATAHLLTVATRDTSPFEAPGVNVLNPWEAGSR